MIAEAIARLRKEFGIPDDPAVRGPVPLNRSFEEFGLSHVAIPGLNCCRVIEHLLNEGPTVEPFDDPLEPLAGCHGA